LENKKRVVIENIRDESISFPLEKGYVSLGSGQRIRLTKKQYEAVSFYFQGHEKAIKKIKEIKRWDFLDF